MVTYNMNIHEYQTKQLLKKFGIPCPEQQVVTKIDELDAAMDKLGIEQAVLKVQVHAGGRGKAGGVKIAKSKNEAKELLKQLLGMKIVTNQTGPEGNIAEKVLISPLVDIEKEYYMAAILDRGSAKGLLIASTEGGVEIEEVAEKTPDKIIKLAIPLNGKFKRYQLYQFVKALGWHAEKAEKGITFIQKLVQAFVETDAMLLEVNPLVLTKSGEILALDAKLSVDDNALFRQPEIKSFYDPKQISPREARAAESDLAYVALDGTIGCMVNGAGLAMATMDIIHAFGGKPANFLDVGGGASKEKVAEGFKIILSDTQVKAILVNIFGGIMDCEVLADGIIFAAKEIGIKVPLVVRMEGTNVEKGKEKLEQSGLQIILSHDLREAAEKVVKAAN